MKELTRGERFKDARTVHNQHGNQTMNAVQSATRVSASLIADLENDEKDRKVNYIDVATLAKHYGVPSDWLLGLTNDHHKMPCAVDELGITDLALNNLNEYTKEQKSGLSQLLEHDFFGVVCGEVSQYSKIPDDEKLEVLQDGTLTRYSEYSNIEHEIEQQLELDNAYLKGKVRVLFGFNYSEFLRKKIIDNFEHVISTFHIAKKRNGRKK